MRSTFIPKLAEWKCAGSRPSSTRLRKPLSEIQFTLADNYDTRSICPAESSPRTTTRLLFQTYALDPPMQPGESRVMHFTVKARNRGFENSVTNREIVQNGTFFNSTVAPMIGYQPTNEMTDRTSAKSSA